MPDNQEGRVAVLVDCENTSPEILEYALRVVARLGRVVVRRGYGNHAALAISGRRRLFGWPLRPVSNINMHQVRIRRISRSRWMLWKTYSTTELRPSVSSPAIRISHVCAAS